MKRKSGYEYYSRVPKMHVCIIEQSGWITIHKFDSCSPKNCKSKLICFILLWVANSEWIFSFFFNNDSQNLNDLQLRFLVGFVNRFIWESSSLIMSTTAWRKAESWKLKVVSRLISIEKAKVESQEFYFKSWKLKFYFQGQKL